MKKAVLLIVSVLAISMMLAIVVPVFASPAQRIPFTATQRPNPIQPPSSPDFRVNLTEGDTYHVRNLLGAGKINSSLTVARLNPNYQGTTSSIIDLNINLKTGEGIIKYNMTWTFSTGSFQGMIIGKLSAAPFTSGQQSYLQELHGVLQGTGAFAGQTIMFDGVKQPGVNPFIWTGTLIIP